MLLSLALGLVCALGLLRDADSLDGLGARTSEVSATSDLYYRLNDMDAQAANALLVGYHPADPAMVPASVDAAASGAAYERDRSAADADLGVIARNPVLTAQASRLLDALGDYEALIAQALYIDQSTQKELPAAPPSGALGLYTEASNRLHGALLPAAQAITQTDAAAVDGSYAADRSTVSAFGYVILALALAAAAALCLGNRYHARRFRRRLGLLGVGTVVSVVLGFVGLAAQLGAAGDLRVAKQEAYDSIYALDRAQAVSDDANADESRWLLEGRGEALQSSFFQKAETVAGAPGVPAAQAGSDPVSYYIGVSSAVGDLRLDAAADTVSGVSLTGYLGSELRNVTFAGEAQAAFDTAKAYDAYLQDDQKIRQDVASGDLSGAVAVDIGLQAGQSDHDFNAYMTALGSVIRINTEHFDDAVATGRADAGAGTWTAVLLGELILVSCVGQAGYLRLREYR